MPYFLFQLGVAEMKSLIERTGGLVVLHDTFIHRVFSDSFLRLFARDAMEQLTLAFAGEIEVFASRYSRWMEEAVTDVHRIMLVKLYPC